MYGYLIRGHMKMDQESNIEKYIKNVKNKSLFYRKCKYISSVLLKHCEDLKNEITLKNDDEDYDYKSCHETLSKILLDLTILSSKMGTSLEKLINDNCN